MAKSRDENAADLKSPLIINRYHHQPPPPPTPSSQELIINVESQEPNGARPPTAENSNSNPFDFLGISGELILPRPSPIDPFRNHTPGTGGLYEWLKILVVLPLALARLAIFGLSIAVGYIATKMALGGWKDRQSPMPRWRCRLMWVTRICSRCILFSFGYQWIKRIGRPAPREIAPIVVSNHISYIEPIFFFYELFPTIVASESHDSLPLVGIIIRAMQVIYVDRFSAESRKHAVSEIKRKASCNAFPRVLLFPEGTTTNGKSLISFQLGAFVPGFPVQPVVVRFPYVHFDQSWGYISLARLMFRMFTQFHNFMEVEYLPIVEPLEGKESVVQFAERTSYAMASTLNIVQTSHSYGDIMLLTRASEISKEKYSSYMIEMASAESAFNITASEAMEFLDQFFAMHPDANGCVKIEDFLMAYGLANNQYSEKIFGFLDVEKKGSITFRQFLLGSAYVRKQPSFWASCEMAFSRCCDENGATSLSLNKLGEIIQLCMPNISNATVCQLFHLLDTDEDGLISREDFMVCLRKNPLLIAFFAPCFR